MILSEKETTPFQIRFAIISLKMGKSEGPNAFSAIFYKKLIDTITAHFATLFKEVKESGTLPIEILNAHIVTVLKAR